MVHKISVALVLHKKVCNKVNCILCNFIDPLSCPENVTFSFQNSSNQLQWEPPYHTLNQESDIIHIDPHITQYTVYIIDAYTGKMIGNALNMTERSFALRNEASDDGLCPMYQVSDWNAGGGGKLSEPVQESSPQGK